MRDKKSIIWLIVGAFVILGMLLLICSLSVTRTKNSEWGSGWFMPTGVELRNTITLSGEQVEDLELSYSSQNIYFYLSDSEDILIQEYLRSDSDEAKAVVSLKDGKAVVKGGTGRKYGIFWININMGGWEKIEVYLPDKMFQTVSVSVSSGNISAQENFAIQCGKLSLKASSGSIRLESSIHAEEVKVQVSSGNIMLKGIEGVVDVEASSGNITLERMRGSGSIETKSGNIRVITEDITGDLSMEASSGNVTLELPEDIQFHFSAATSSGNIKTDFDDSLSYNKRGNEAEGDVGQKPTIQINMRAKSGNVRAVH